MQISSTGTSRRPPGPDDARDRAGGDQRRHAVGGRRGVAQVAAHGGAALDLDRADQLDRLDHARPGRRDLGMLAELHAGDRRADAKAAVLGGDLPHLRDLLDVDQELGLDQVGAHLHDQVGAARQHARLAARAGEEARPPHRESPGPGNACRRCHSLGLLLSSAQIGRAGNLPRPALLPQEACGAGPLICRAGEPRAATDSLEETFMGQGLPHGRPPQRRGDRPQRQRQRRGRRAPPLAGHLPNVNEGASMLSSDGPCDRGNPHRGLPRSRTDSQDRVDHPSTVRISGSA